MVPGRLEAVLVEAHGIVCDKVEDVEPATSIYEHFGQSYHADNGVDDKQVSTWPWKVLRAVELIKSNGMVRLSKEGRGW